MKGIKIKKTVYNDLTAFREDLPITKTVKLIVDNAEPVDCIEEQGQKSININIHDDTFDKLKLCKLTPSETHSETIARLLKEYKDKHSEH